MTVELFQHQEEDLEALRTHRYYALFHEVGVGKTFPLLFWMLENLMHSRRMWIVVAELHLLPQWRKAIREVQEMFGIEPTITTLSGSVKKHHRILAKHTPPDILLVNYEYFPKLVEDWLFPLACARGVQGMILDEGHRVKGFRGFRSKKGKRAKAIFKVAHARLGVKGDIMRYIATGSPVTKPNKPELWALYYFLHPDVLGKRLWLFEQEFYINVTPGQPFKKLVLRDTMKAEISRRMYTCARRLLKKELPVEFPVASTVPYFVEMPAQVRKFYKQMQTDALASHEGQTFTRPQLLGRLMALQQVSSGFIMEAQQTPVVGLDLDWEEFDASDGATSNKNIVHLDSSHKDKVVLSIMESIGMDTSIAWWGHFRHELRHLADMLEKEGIKVARSWGDIPQKDKDRNLLAFQEGDLTALVGQPASCGAGLNLQIAGYTGRYSRSHRLLDWEQSRGRIDRPIVSGAHPNITHFEIVTERSSDQDVYDSLIADRDLSSELTLDDFRELRA